uniref:Uncharacterized protein n=1 Tax=Aegilops tauschii TaxID=37682 RepID=M8BEA1_AEGTA
MDMDSLPPPISPQPPTHSSCIRHQRRGQRGAPGDCRDPKVPVLQGGRKRRGGEDGGPGSPWHGGKAATHLESGGSGPDPCSGAGF